VGVGLGFHVAGLGVTVLDLIGLGAAAGALIALMVRAARNLRALAEREPSSA
jgi:hypothetical protein